MHRWLRVLIPSLLIVAWFAVAGVGGPYFGRVDEVSSNDPTAYLPTSAQATEVQQRLADFTGSDAIPAVVIVVAESPLDAAQVAHLRDMTTAIADVDAVVGESSPAVISDDGQAAVIFVPLDSSASIGDVVGELRAAVREERPTETEVYVTGPAGFSGDLVDAFGGIDGLLLLVAVLAVLVILIVVYRSLLLPIIVLLTSIFALCAALLTVWWLAKTGVVLLSGQTQGILFILVIGAATDYSLLYVARYREALRMHRSPWDASWAALRRATEPILASGGTVIAGLLCLLLSDLMSNRALGPVAAIGIVFSMLGALTLLPALLLVTGRVAFWPRRPTYSADPASTAGATGVWAKLPRFVGRHARGISIVVVVVLVAGGLGLLQLKADGVAGSELVLGASEARDGQALLAEHFPGGSGSPVQVITQVESLQDVADVLLANPQIESVAVVSADSPSGSAPVTEDGVQSIIPASPAPEPTISDGDVLLQATLVPVADSPEAEDAVRELRIELDEAALVGGATATDIDSNDASIHDRTVIIPLVLAVILMILMILLRAIVAPLVLIGTVVLSFAAALGISALFFEHVLRMPGADPAVPLFGFVFLVALGVDYNIFLMTRVREEALVHGARAGMDRGLAVTGGVITSAGLVLAATFAALAVIPILFLVQLAVIVALGVLLETFIVRSLLVPALGHELGRAMWWPSTKIGA